jgi:uncharacterized cupredoxin-like copper-binding protein
MSEQEKHEVRIHIDRKPYMSPRITTRAALYILAHIATGYELFREVKGDHEDEPAPNDQAEIHLKEDEHFYSAQVTLNPGAGNDRGCD